MCEAFTPSVLLANKLKSTKTNTKALGINGHAVLNDLNREGIKRLIAKSAGPPKLSVADLTFFICGKVVTLAVGSKNAYGNCSVCISINDGSNEDSAILMLLLDLEVSDARAVLSEKIYTSPDTHIGKHRTPVPTKHTVRLTDIAKARHCLNVLEEVKILTLFLYVGVDIAAGNAESVLSVNKVIGNVELVCDVHIIEICKVMTVEIYVSKGIYTLKAEDVRVLTLFKLEGAAEGVIVMRKSKRIELIVAPIGVLHQSRVKKEGIKRAGDCALALKACALHFPNSVKR